MCRIVSLTLLYFRKSNINFPMLPTNTFKSLPYLFVVFVFFANLFFKLVNITTEPIWYDECFSIFHSQADFDEIITVSMWDINPPFFNLYLHIWIKLFGISELSMRLVPAIFSALTGGVLFLFLKRYVELRAAITASVL